MNRTIDPTIHELRKIFVENQLDFFINEENEGIIKVHFIVRKDKRENE